LGNSVTDTATLTGAQVVALGKMIGNGPFVMTRYEPSVGMTWSKNPNFWEKGLPYVDKMEVPFITEYATGLAQLKAGNIYTYTAPGSTGQRGCPDREGDRNV